MSTYYETFLRKDICRDMDYYADIIIEVYESEPKKKSYINGIMQAYISGQINEYQAFKYLYSNIIDWYKRIKENTAYLDEEYEEKMK